jgi:hypothetical protein
MRIGLIIGLLLLDSRSRTRRERAVEAGRESQSRFYYPGLGRGRELKLRQGNHGVDPCGSDEVVRA